jgi:Zn-dependent peptidase ImmA (M78 family)
MLDDDAVKFRNRLQNLGLSESVITAAWPSWWSEDADASPSARAELRYSIARKLGLEPHSLLEDEGAPEFVWKDPARFKHLSGETDIEKWALTSFGRALAAMLLSGVRSEASIEGTRASLLRSAILDRQPYIRLLDLLSLCWAVGVPTVHPRVFPLPQKRMVAMSVRAGKKSAILLGKDAQYPAQIAFYLAHELGHISLGHLKEDEVLIDLESSTVSDVLPETDPEEIAADAFALELLTGNPKPIVLPATRSGGPRSLARTALNVASDLKIEPGTLALCFGYSTGDWATAMGALPYIYASAKPVWQEVNSIAISQLSFSELPEDTILYLKNILGETN